MNIRMTARVAFVLTVAAARADQWVASGRTREGTFLGFENGRFLFSTEKGLVQESPSSVSRVVLAQPVRVTYQTTTESKPHPADLKAFERRHFLFLTPEGEVAVPLLRIRSVSLAAPAGSHAELLERGEDRYPIPAVRLPPLDGAPLSADQKAAVDRFRAAQRAFDEYVAASSALVVEMNQATGERRQKLLDQLRLRKQDEQPLKEALVQAYRDLLKAFPKPSPDS